MLFVSTFNSAHSDSIAGSLLSAGSHCLRRAGSVRSAAPRSFTWARLQRQHPRVPGRGCGPAPPAGGAPHSRRGTPWGCGTGSWNTPRLSTYSFTSKNGTSGSLRLRYEDRSRLLLPLPCLSSPPPNQKVLEGRRRRTWHLLVKKEYGSLDYLWLSKILETRYMLSCCTAGHLQPLDQFWKSSEKEWHQGRTTQSQNTGNTPKQLDILCLSSGHSRKH